MNDVLLNFIAIMGVSTPMFAIFYMLIVTGQQYSNADFRKLRLRLESLHAKVDYLCDGFPDADDRNPADEDLKFEGSNLRGIDTSEHPYWGDGISLVDPSGQGFELLRGKTPYQREQLGYEPGDGLPMTVLPKFQLGDFVTAKPGEPFTALGFEIQALDWSEHFQSYRYQGGAAQPYWMLEEFLERAEKEDT